MPTILELKTMPGLTPAETEPLHEGTCRLFTERQNDGSSYISVKFDLDAKSSHGSIHNVIEPGNFEQLAQIMLETDTATAIRAFGAALARYKVGALAIEAEG